MLRPWPSILARWIDAGLIDADTAARIEAFEAERDASAGFGWPIRIALAFGALMLGAGVLLFVSAHWDTLSPAARFTLVVLLVAIFHVAAAFLAGRFPATASALHAVGTVALGAGIFLAGQIFNLEEHWPGGVMLWALGAALAWALLRDVPQLVLLAVLGPAWLVSEWLAATSEAFPAAEAPEIFRVPACGVFLLSLSYFTAVLGRAAADPRSRTLLRVGGLALLPAALAVVAAMAVSGPAQAAPLEARLRLLGWAVALGLPLLVAVWLRRAAAWPNLLAACWVVGLVAIGPTTGALFGYAWWALGATALVGWGVAEARIERINVGSAVFAATILAFYFSEVMDKLGRSASLVVFGVVSLAGGWALERLRRRLVLRTRGGQA